MKPLQQKLAQYTLPQQAKAKGVYPYFTPISSEQNTEVMVSGRKMLMFGSNSYLGLTNHPKIKEAAKLAIDKYGTGCAGSPFLNGTLDVHIQLQDELAEFLGKDGVLAPFPVSQAVRIISSMTSLTTPPSWRANSLPLPPRSSISTTTWKTWSVNYKNSPWRL